MKVKGNILFTCFWVFCAIVLSGLIISVNTNNFENKKIAQKNIVNYLSSETNKILTINNNNKSEQFLLNKMKDCFFSEVYFNFEDLTTSEGFLKIEYKRVISQDKKNKIINDCLEQYKNKAKTQQDFIDRTDLIDVIRSRSGLDF